jgi:hypothetical protein
MAAIRSIAVFFLPSLFALVAAGCGGGGGGGSSALPPTQASNPGAPPAGGPATDVAFSISIPAVSTSAARRAPRYVSAGAKSLRISADNQNAVVNCTNVCTGALRMVPGTYLFTMALYDATDGAGHVLSGGSTSSTVVGGQTNVVQVTFGGVVASVALALAPATLHAGFASDASVAVVAKDAAGFVIVGQEPFVAPVALTNADTSGATTLSTSVLTAPSTPVTLHYNGAPLASARVSASVPGTSVGAATAMLTIAAAPAPPPTATPAPTPTPVATPVPTPVPTLNPSARVHVWGLGEAYGLGQGNQGPDEPVFGLAPSRCDASGQCIGGSGPVSFHVERPNVTTIPAAEYRNLIVLEKPDAHGYGMNYELGAGTIYDVRFQTVYRYQQDAPKVQSLLWQIHDGDSNVLTGFGVDNEDGKGSRFCFNYSEHPDGTPAPWHSEIMTPGHVDSWEIQFRNAADASGWIDLYRNGVKQLHYDGRTVTTTRYDLMSFGIYYYNWNIARSTVLSQDMTFNTFDLSTIPGPVPPS